MANSTKSTRRQQVPTLDERAQEKTVASLCSQIQEESKRSIFAIGGSVLITNLDNRFICESDDTASESSHEPSKGTSTGQGRGSENDPMLIDSADSEEGSHQHLADEYSDFPLDAMPTRAMGSTLSDAPLSPVGNEAPSHKMRCDPVTIRWDSISKTSTCHKVTLPYTDEERPSFEQLLKDCQPATFGRDGMDVMDETYRKAGKLDEAAFSTNLSPCGLGIVDTAAQALAPNNCKQTNGTHGIRAELYKLNIYAAPSGRFKAHVDTPRSKHQIGSLVVCLPSVHEGGQLVLRHQGRETVFDWSGPKGKDMIQWAAFFSDCEHEVLEVTAGERVTLTYNLYATCSANTASIDPERVMLYSTLKALLVQPAFCANGAVLGYHCAHAYPHTSGNSIPTLPAVLKGIDKIIFTCFAATNHPVRLRHLLEFHENNDDIDDTGNDQYGRLLNRFDADSSRFRALKNEYRRVEDVEARYYGRGRYQYSWEKIDEDKPTDVALLSYELVPMKHSEVGIDREIDLDEIIETWTDDFSFEKVKWLNKPSHQELALVHGAYGNQASIDTKYARLVITLDIPPSQDR